MTYQHGCRGRGKGVQIGRQQQGIRPNLASVSGESHKKGTRILVVSPLRWAFVRLPALEVVHRAELAVLLGDVCLGQRDIAIGHFEVGVAQDFFEREDLTAVPQEGHGHRMPEGVRRAARRHDLSHLARPLDDLPDPPPCQGLPRSLAPIRAEQRGLRVFNLIPQVEEQGLRRGAPEVYRPALVSLP